jgi:hypothetical protein
MVFPRPDRRAGGRKGPGPAPAISGPPQHPRLRTGGLAGLPFQAHRHPSASLWSPKLPQPRFRHLTTVTPPADHDDSRKPDACRESVSKPDRGTARNWADSPEVPAGTPVAPGGKFLRTAPTPFRKREVLQSALRLGTARRHLLDCPSLRSAGRSASAVA